MLSAIRNWMRRGKQETIDHSQLPGDMKAAALILGALLVAKKYELTEHGNAPELSQFGWQLFRQLHAEKYQPTDQEWDDILGQFVVDEDQMAARYVVELVLSDAWPDVSAR